MPPTFLSPTFVLLDKQRPAALLRLPNREQGAQERATTPPSSPSSLLCVLFSRFEDGQDDANSAILGAESRSTALFPAENSSSRCVLRLDRSGLAFGPLLMLSRCSAFSGILCRFECSMSI